jgi:hypothetical protein
MRRDDAAARVVHDRFWSDRGAGEPGELLLRIAQRERSVFVLLEMRPNGRCALQGWGTLTRNARPSLKTS